jgi:thiamine biosynthesis lipoprotein
MLGWGMKKIRYVPLLLAVLAVMGCRKGEPPKGEQAAEFVLGTVCSVTLYGGNPAETFSRVFARLREIDRLMSANREGSALDRINQKAGLEPVPVPPELMEVLEKARYYADLGGGAFDPTIGPLVKLWDIGSEEPRVPGDDEIRQALALVNREDLILDREAGTAFLARPGMALDLGAIAKGYAADEARRIVREGSCRGAIIDLGGNILVCGERPEAGGGGRPWRIGVQDPLDSRGAYIGVLEVREASVVTSGVYERFFEAGGRRYHHILSTETGCPVENGLLSVTIVAEKSIDADALSTLVFTLGYEAGLEALKALDGVGAVFVFEDRRIRLSPGLGDSFTLTSDIYRLEFAPLLRP